jgi:F-type H+-transporting ATPase subunit b
MGGILKALDIDGTFIYQIIDFLLLFLFLRVFVWPPLVQALERRRQTVEQQLVAAERERQEAAALREQQERAIAEARAQAQAIVERAQRAAAEEAKELLQEARELAERTRRQLSEELQREREAALAAVRSEVVDLVLALEEKLLRARVGAEEDRRLVQRLLAESAAPAEAGRAG